MPRVVAIRDQQQPQYRKYLLLSNDKILASARTRQQRRGEARVISDLHVEPEYRNIGLGRMIMAGILEREPRPVALRVGAYGEGDKPNDDQLTKFYASLGFEPAEGGYMRKAAAGMGWQLGAATADDLAGGVAGVGVNKLITGALDRHVGKQPQLANMGEWAKAHGAPGQVRGNDYISNAFAYPDGKIEVGKGWATPSMVAHEIGHTKQPKWLKTVAPALRVAPQATAVDWGDAGFQLGRNGRIAPGTAARMGAGVAAGVAGAADEMDAWRRAGKITDVDPKTRALSLASYLAPNVTVGGGRFASGYVRGLGENPNITNQALRVVSRAAPVIAGAAGVAQRAQAYYGQNPTLHAAGETAGGVVKGLATTPGQLTGRAPVNPVAVMGRYAALSAGEQAAPAVSGALNDLKSRVPPEVYAAIKTRASQEAAKALGGAARTSLPGLAGRVVGEAAGPIGANMLAKDVTKWGLSKAVGGQAAKRLAAGPLYAAAAGAVDLGQQLANPKHFAGIAAKSRALDDARRFVVGAPATRRTLLAERILNVLSHPIALGTGAVTDAVRRNPDGMHKHVGNIVRDAYREVVPERSIMDRLATKGSERMVGPGRLLTRWELLGWGESKEEGRRRSAIVDRSGPGSTVADWEAKEAVVRRQGKRWALMTRDGSRVLGTHDKAQDAYKQEYAIQKSQERSKEASTGKATSWRLLRLRKRRGECETCGKSLAGGPCEDCNVERVPHAEKVSALGAGVGALAGGAAGYFGAKRLSDSKKDKGRPWWSKRPVLGAASGALLGAAAGYGVERAVARPTKVKAPAAALPDGPVKPVAPTAPLGTNTEQAVRSAVSNSVPAMVAPVMNADITKLQAGTVTADELIAKYKLQDKAAPILERLAASGMTADEGLRRMGPMLETLRNPSEYFVRMKLTSETLPLMESLMGSAYMGRAMGGADRMSSSTNAGMRQMLDEIRAGKNTATISMSKNDFLGAFDGKEHQWLRDLVVPYTQQQAPTNVVMNTKGGSALPVLLEAKAHSDKRDYARKHALLRGIIASAPKDFVIDSQARGITGITHVPTRFAIHMPTRAVPAELTSRAPAIAKKNGDEPVTGAEKTASMQEWVDNYRVNAYLGMAVVERVPCDEFEPAISAAGP